jgi:transmembrane sensor
MKPPPSESSTAAHAAEWVMRHDRGLTPAEQDRYLQWLAADPRHAAEMARLRGTWEAFDRLAGIQANLPAAPDPDLFATASTTGTVVRTRPRVWWLAGPLAAAAALMLLLWPADRSPVAPISPPPANATTIIQLPLITQRELDDGSIVQLNRGAEIRLEFTPAERRVRLIRGEAAFEVAKDSARPFIVITGGVSTRAVGTAFNVRLAADAVEVIVTEGVVAVADAASTAAVPPANLGAGESIRVPIAAGLGRPAVVPLAAADLDRRLAWHPRLLTFNDQPLAVIVNEFNRHNPVALHLADPALRELRLTVRFRSDNVEGFLRLLASDFGVRAAAGGGPEITLHAVGR